MFAAIISSFLLSESQEQQADPERAIEIFGTNQHVCPLSKLPHTQRDFWQTVRYGLEMWCNHLSSTSQQSGKTLRPRTSSYCWRSRWPATLGFGWENWSIRKAAASSKTVGGGIKDLVVPEQRSLQNKGKFQGTGLSWLCLLLRYN